MQNFIIFFIIVYAPHVSGGFSAYHQELKNCTHRIWYVPGFEVFLYVLELQAPVNP
jgi:hypothetical protein